MKSDGGVLREDGSSMADVLAIGGGGISKCSVWMVGESSGEYGSKVEG